MLALVAPHRCELRYYSKMDEASYGGGRVPSDCKGVIHLDSTDPHCSVRRNVSSNSANTRIDLVAPRLQGTHQGVSSDSVASSKILHKYSLRAKDANETWKWFTTLRSFLGGDDSGGLDAEESEDSSGSSDSDAPELPARRGPGMTDRQRRLARRKELEESKRRVISSPRARPKPATVYQPPAPVYQPPAPAVAQKPVYRSPKVWKQPKNYNDGRLMSRPPPGIRRASKVVDDRIDSLSGVISKADSTKLKSNPPPGVRRASQQVHPGKLLFRKASGAIEPRGQNSLHRTASAISRELESTVPLPVNIRVPSTNATSKDGDYRSSVETRLNEPPPGIRTASMVDLGLGTLGRGKSRNDQHARTASAIHRDLGGFVPPPPPDSDSDEYDFDDSIDNIHHTYRHGTSYSTGPGRDISRGSLERSGATRLANETRRRQGHNGRGERGFSIVGEILDGAATADDVAPQPRMIPSPEQYGYNVKSVLDTNPSKRTMRHRKYSSSLESVIESPLLPTVDTDASSHRQESTEHASLIDAATRLYDENRLSHSEYLKMTDAIISGDQEKINAMESLLKAI